MIFRIITAATGFLLCSAVASATMLNCPQPNQVNCIPASSNISGWMANGGQMTGNTFAPNSQCANVIGLSSDSQRLICCYTKCGVFFRDVRAHRCVKLNQSSFNCE